MHWAEYMVSSWYAPLASRWSLSAVPCTRPPTQLPLASMEALDGMPMSASQVPGSCSGGKLSEGTEMPQAMDLSR